MKRRRQVQQYDIELKRRAVGQVLSGSSVDQVSRALGIARRSLFRWCAQVRSGGLSAVRRTGRPRREGAAGRLELDEAAVGRRRIADLERLVGQQQADLDFFRQALRHVKGRQQPSAGPGGLRSTKSSGR